MSTSEFANAKAGADTQLRPPPGTTRSGPEDKPKIKQPPILSLRVAGEEPGAKASLSQNPGLPRPQLRSPTANNQQAPYPMPSSFHPAGIGYNRNQPGYAPPYNGYPSEPPPFFPAPPTERQDIHPATNFYRTEMEAAPTAGLPPHAAGLTDEQILNQVDQEKKTALEQQALENMTANEQAALLKSMFREVGVSLTWRFDDALRNAKQDSRFKYLKMAMATKKQVFA